MKRRIAWSLVLIVPLTLAAPAGADEVVTFEDFGLPAHSFDNNAGGSYFNIDGHQFNNSFDPTFAAWSGWAISSMTDTTTPDFTNQYSAIPGSGAGGSQTYAVAFTFSSTADPFHPAGSWINLPAGENPTSIDVTNTTYAYYTMLNGSQFSSPFTSSSFFKLDVAGYTGADGTGTLLGDVPFNLATGTNILNTWKTIDLTSLAGSKSLVFGLQSSDNDPVFGMNTPAYFAADNLVETASGVVPEPGTLTLALFGLATVAAVPWKKIGSGLGARRQTGAQAALQRHEVGCE
jgi:hypothetical protein